MTLQHLSEMAVFSAVLPDGKVRHFTFAEWLGWFDLYDTPLNEADQADWFSSFCGRNANNHRVLAWKKIAEEWREQVSPDDNRRIRSHKVLQAYKDT